MSMFSAGGLMAPTASAAPAAAPAVAGNFDWLQSIGMGLGLADFAMSTTSTYYGLKAQQGQFRAEAQNMEFAANQAAMRSRAAQREAQDIIVAGQQEAAWRGAQAAYDTASLEAATAASGAVVGKGSARDLERAIRINAEVDRRTILTNAQRRANAVREGGANESASSLLMRASAANARSSASSINPTLGAAATGLGKGADLIGQHLAYYGRR